MGKFLAYYGLTSLDDVEDKAYPLDDNKEFRRAEQFADPALAKKLKAVKDSNELNTQRLRLMDVLRQIIGVKATQESMQIMAQCTDDSYEKVEAFFDSLLRNKYITLANYREYRNTAQSQSHALRFLRENLEICECSTIFADAPYRGYFRNQETALDSLVAAGLLEKHGNGYCWPGVQEEKERKKREAEEKSLREAKQIEAYDEACSAIERRIQEEIVRRVNEITHDYDVRLREIQGEINENIAEINRQKGDLERKISDCRTQQSLLGVFKGREKKALQAQIDEAQNRINSLPTQQRIQANYQTVMNRLQAEKEAEISRIKDEIRAHNPMPNLNDFVV